MESLENILNKIKFPQEYYNFEFNKPFSEIEDSQGFVESKKIDINNKYIEFFIYRRREKHEYWNSIDIYIQIEKIKEFFDLIFPTEKIEFELTTNNTQIFFQEIDSLKRFEIIKIENRIVIQITKFDNQ